MSNFTKEQAIRLRGQLLRAVAELASSLKDPADFDSPDGTDTDTPMQDGYPPDKIPIFSTSEDLEESRLEAQEIGKYLLAKSFFDCREYDRCAAVFLPLNSSPTVISASSPESRTQTPTQVLKGKEKATSVSPEVKQRTRRNDLPRLSQKSLFLALYAKYMAGEKRKDEDSEMIMGPMDTGAIVNKELVDIGRRLDDWFHERTLQGKEAQNQGWLEYLYGIILAKSNSSEDAKDYLVKSVNLNPFNWSAWLELRDLLGNVDAVSSLSPLYHVVLHPFSFSQFKQLRTISPTLPPHLFAIFFHLDVNVSLYQTSPSIHSNITELLMAFPTSSYLLTQRALLFYHSKDYDESESIFSSLIATSPHRLDSLDHYSNVLYVMHNRPKLAFLAHLATATDKFRPETCCVVGNYYSLTSEHEKAIMYFRRALTLDRTFLSAWTLMGHEYVEMKNTHAAISSYRRAVDINTRDYRAWYGLGQTYEVLEMHHYALWYFQRAAALRPYDKQMWQALGACYQKIDRPVEAIKALKRALMAGMAFIEPSSASPSAAAATSSFGSGISGDFTNVFLDPEILYPIAMLHETLHDLDAAAEWMDLVVAQEEGPLVHPDEQPDAGGTGGTGVTVTTSRARMWLARWAMQKGELGRAMELAGELCQDGFEVEEAKALIRDLRARMEVVGGK
ncbi:MAG: hypothetical protein Q9200_004168 [Gallowayella weberi]